MITEFQGQKFTLLPQKALYKHDERVLIIADVHLGKASHFRREGIAIPAHTQGEDYVRLAKLFESVTPARVYFLGDLFHSSLNRDWHQFCNLIAQFPHISFTLVRGNHDVIDSALFEKICVHVTDIIEDEHFVYAHDVPQKSAEGKLTIVGHVHPGVALGGAARQNVTLPCFYLRGQTLILPAFGMLTGLRRMPHTRQSSVFIVLPHEVRELPTARG